MKRDHKTIALLGGDQWSGEFCIDQNSTVSGGINDNLGVLVRITYSRSNPSGAILALTRLKSNFLVAASAFVTHAASNAKVGESLIVTRTG